ncbi:MAG: UDP-N-acetylglucosamine 1-carboxyvinyltransferase [Candidatus Gracilibacteria bacterium]|jgi:UDP-N-acetylglucosamine 1-carboxyvinyltransferase
MSKFIIQGGIPLKGEVTIGGSKNAVLPILAATLLTNESTTLHNVPDISDVHAFLKILSGLGAEVSFEAGTVKVNPDRVQKGNIEPNLVKHMRASILLLGPLLARWGEVDLAFPGGCVLGKRSVHAHLHALTKLGASVIASEDSIHLKAEKLRSAQIIMAEASVTATENALMAATLIPGETEIRWAAMEPHVQDLCHFLMSMGAEIEGIGTPTLRVHGGKPLHGTEYTVTSDYLEAGTLALAAVLTNGTVTLKNCPVSHLDSFWQKLEEVGAHIELDKDEARMLPHGELHGIEKLQTSVYPGFATDLQAPFAVLLTQCAGQSKVHETLFEGRLNYLPELDRLGAKTQLLNPHQAVITGPMRLKAAPIASQDIRAGAAMVLAALIAEGQTEISDINYIDRGYERLDEKLRSLGAKITRSQE